MTINITVRCDYCADQRTLEYPDCVEQELENLDWHENPELQDDHYCAKCWPIAKKENPGWED